MVQCLHLQLSLLTRKNCLSLYSPFEHLNFEVSLAIVVRVPALEHMVVSCKLKEVIDNTGTGSKHCSKVGVVRLVRAAFAAVDRCPDLP